MRPPGLAGGSLFVVVMAAPRTALSERLKPEAESSATLKVHFPTHRSNRSGKEEIADFCLTS